MKQGSVLHIKPLMWLSWGCLLYIVFVIAWGAFVRASGSGAGCGSHWPLCNGTVLPEAPSTATLIEFSHRLTSGISLLLVAILFVLVRRSTIPGSTLRRGATWSLIFILGEALVGAILVLQHLVAEDSSLARAVVIALHLVNTQFLVGALVWTAMSATVSAFGIRLESLCDEAGEKLKILAPGAYRNLLRIAGLFLLVGASGAIVALGDTLFPAAGLVEGIKQDFNPGAHFLIRLRIVHPVIAIGAAIAMWVVVARLERQCDARGLLPRALFFARFCLIAQVTIGILNWLMMAPTWLQLVHLIGSNAVWVSLVILIYCLKFIAKPEALS